MKFLKRVTAILLSGILIFSLTACGGGKSRDGKTHLTFQIWDVAQRDGMQAVCDALCAEYDAEPARIRDDLLALVTQLAEAGLVKLN